MVTTEQKKKILKRISEIECDIDKLKQARMEIASSGYASATLSSGGGSKSYTRLDMSKITELISALTSELKKLRNMLSGGAQQTLWANTLIVYS